MSAPDFAAILDAAFDDEQEFPTAYPTPRLLAAKVPELCPACDGFGCSVIIEDGECPDCPTIAKLLAIGAAVIDAVVTFDGTSVNVDNYGTTFTPEQLLKALRSVTP